MPKLDLTEALRSVASLVGRDKDEGTSKGFRSEESLVRLLEKLQERHEKDREPYEHEWYMNYAYAYGEQYVDWSKEIGDFHVEDAPSWRKRHTVNLIAPALQRKLAKLMRLRPNPELIPNSMQYDDQRKAELCQRILEVVFATPKMIRSIQKLVITADCCGRSYAKLIWNAKAGNFIPMEADGSGHNEGDIDISVEDPFTFYYDPAAEYLDDARWCISCRTRHMSWVHDNFPEVAAQIEEEGSKSYKPSGIFDKLMHLIRGGEQKHCPQKVIVREYWQRPCPSSKDPMAKKGFYFITIEDKLAKKPTEFPFENGKLPWVEMTDAYLQGLCKHGPTQVAQLRPMQDMYNDTESTIYENLEQFAKPKWLVPEACDIDDDALTSEPGEIVKFTRTGDGAEPRPVVPKDPNAQSYQMLLNQTLGDFDNVSCQHEVSRGVAPGANSTGYAIEILQQADDTAMRPQADDYTMVLSEMMRRVLALYKQYGTDKREMVKFKGNNSYETFDFTGKDISYRALRIEPNSMKPTSPLAMRQQIIQLAQVGAFGPYESKDHELAWHKALRTMQWGNFEGIWDEVNKDRERAEWENKQLDQVTEMVPSDTRENSLGEPIMEPVIDPELAKLLGPHPSDDDDEHIASHELRQKDLSFNELPEAARRAHMEHLDRHKYQKVMKSQEAEQIGAELTSSGLLQPTSPQQAAMANPELMNEVAQGGAPQEGPPMAEGPIPPEGQEPMLGPEIPV
jgi:hypothetical protein